MTNTTSRHLVQLGFIIAVGWLGATRAPAQPRALERGPTLERIQHRGRLVVGNSLQYQLLNTASAPGQNEGFLADIARELAKRLINDGDKLDWKQVPESDCFTAVNAGDVDVIVDVIDKGRHSEREGLAEFSAEVLRSGPALLVRKGSPIVTPNDILPGTRVAFVPTSPAAHFVRTIHYRAPNAKLLEFPNALEGFKAVEEGKADVFTDGLPQLYDLVSRHAGYTLVGRYADKPCYIITAKGDAQMRQAVEQYMDEIRKSGLYEHLYQKWFAPYGGLMVQ